MVPYLAVAWDWKPLQSYHWQVPQHINVLELLAFFNYVRAWSASPAAHGLRYFHILDSRLCACVLAKGRSSSHALNRILRRIASVLLAADLTLCVRFGQSRRGFFRTTGPGPLRGRVFNERPRVKRPLRRKIRATDLGFAAITDATILRYKRAVSRFFVWLKEAKLALPTTLSELNARLGDYLNYSYQDELPLNWGSDTVSGFKRLYPACRRHLETSHMYYRNWCKTIVRVRAFPLSADLVKGMGQ